MKKITGDLLYAALWKGVLTVFVLALICVLLKCIKDSRKEGCNPSECYHAEYLSPNIYYHNTDDGRSFIYNNLTGEKTLDNIKWIAMPQGTDSLVCFSNGKKRGYFSKYSGRVVIEPVYNRAWIFSNGLASVEEGDISNSLTEQARLLLIGRWHINRTWAAMCFMKAIV